MHVCGPQLPTAAQLSSVMKLLPQHLTHMQSLQIVNGCKAKTTAVQSRPCTGLI